MSTKDEGNYIRENTTHLPENPGIYKFFDKDGILIYVGKAKNIRKRAASYFSKASQDRKTQKLVSQIHHIDFTIVNSEFDALLLENNLIKSHQPKYNILLKDDKTYPYLYVSDERFPRLISTRKPEDVKGTIYGPYTSVKAMNTLLELLRKLFYLRTCNFNLSEKNIQDKKFKVCLEYHIGNCKAPCEGLAEEEEYNRNIAQVHHVLKGNFGMAKQHFREEMKKFSANLEFEKAQLYLEKLNLLEKFQSGSVVVNPKFTDLDVVTIKSNEKLALVNYLRIVNGSILQTKTLEIKKKLDETEEDILLLALISLREEFHSTSKEILTNITVEIPHEDIHATVPVIGDKRKLVELSLQNIAYHFNKLTEEKQREERTLKALMNDLRLKNYPDHIECFDNSNIQGAHPVAAMVCFKNGKPAKKEYRHYNIKTVEGPNDFDSMHEVVARRYRRCMEENLPLPKLIIIDGGKGQLSAACNALKELGIYGEIPVIGIAKRLEEIYFPGDSDPLFLDKKSESLRLIQFIRNEAHRFAINFHRDKRSNAATSGISSIKGIGEKTMQKLLIHFKSVENIRKASPEELLALIGKKKTEELLAALN